MASVKDEVEKKEEQTFEEKVMKLEKIVKDLEEGNVNLDDAIKKYTEAMVLAKECHDELQKAEEKVNKIMTENGSLEDFEANE